VDAGDHRLRQPAQRLHHVGAAAEQLAVLRLRPADHLAQVVAGAEGRPVGRQHDDAGLAVSRDRGECRAQPGQQLGRQGVALLGPIQR
jgi:hypothetical protein